MIRVQIPTTRMIPAIRMILKNLYPPEKIPDKPDTPSNPGGSGGSGGTGGSGGRGLQRPARHGDS